MNKAHGEQSGSTSGQPQAKKVPCINCRSLITRDANICSVCKSHQQQWRNTVTYIASITGFVTLIASAVTFIYSQLSSIVQTERISTAYLKYPGEIVLTNSGDRDLFVASLEFYWRNRNNNTQVPLNVTVKSGEIKSVTPEFFDPRTQESKLIPISEVESFYWIVSRSGTPHPKFFAESAPQQKGKCVIYSFVSGNHYDINRVNDYYKTRGHKLITGPVEAYLNWVSSNSGKLIQTALPDVLIAFRLQPRDDCKESDWNEGD